MKQVKNRSLRWLAMLLATLQVMLVFAVVPVSAADDPTSGTCGENLTWTLDGGTLTISGSGNMGDYLLNPPWYRYEGKIYRVNINPGVTKIGSCAFWNCYNLEDVSLPEGITSIGNQAFYNC